MGAGSQTLSVRLGREEVSQTGWNTDIPGVLLVARVCEAGWAGDVRVCCGASVPVCPSVRSRCRSVGVCQCVGLSVGRRCLTWLLSSPVPLSWTVPVTVCILTDVSGWIGLGVGVKMGRDEGGESTACTMVGRVRATKVVWDEVRGEESAEDSNRGNSSSDEIWRGGDRVRGAVGGGCRVGAGSRTLSVRWSREEVPQTGCGGSAERGCGHLSPLLQKGINGYGCK